MNIYYLIEVIGQNYGVSCFECVLEAYRPLMQRNLEFWAGDPAAYSDSLHVGVEAFKEGFSIDAASDPCFFRVLQSECDGLLLKLCETFKPLLLDRLKEKVLFGNFSSVENLILSSQYLKILAPLVYQDFPIDDYLNSLIFPAFFGDSFSKNIVIKYLYLISLELIRSWYDHFRLRQTAITSAQFVAALIKEPVDPILRLQAVDTLYSFLVSPVLFCEALNVPEQMELLFSLFQFFEYVDELAQQELILLAISSLLQKLNFAAISASVPHLLDRFSVAWKNSGELIIVKSRLINLAQSCVLILGDELKEFVHLFIQIIGFSLNLDKVNVYLNVLLKLLLIDKRSWFISRCSFTLETVSFINKY